MPETPGETGASSSFASYIDSIVPAVFESDSALARAVGVHRATITRWRQGAVPTVPYLLKLSKATGMPLDSLLKIAGYREDDGR
jgi:transcriptional regulator with XRE-family HTH domain